MVYVVMAEGNNDVNGSCFPDAVFRNEDKAEEYCKNKNTEGSNFDYVCYEVDMFG